MGARVRTRVKGSIHNRVYPSQDFCFWLRECNYAFLVWGLPMIYAMAVTMAHMGSYLQGNQALCKEFSP